MKQGKRSRQPAVANCTYNVIEANFVFRKMYCYLPGQDFRFSELSLRPCNMKMNNDEEGVRVRERVRFSVTVREM